MLELLNLSFGIDAKTVACTLVLICYLILFSEKINRAVVTLLTATIMIFFGLLTQAQAFSGIDFNENGKLLVDKLQNIINAENELYDFAEKLKVPTHLRIGTYASIAQYLLPEIIKNFKQENPNIKLSIKVGNKMAGGCRGLRNLSFCSIIVCMSERSWEFVFGG